MFSSNNDDDDETNKGMAHLHWARSNRQQPSFCVSPYPLNMTSLSRKVYATPETIAAIFAIAHPETITLRELGAQIPDNNDKNGNENEEEEPGQELALVEGKNYWPVEPDTHYRVHVSNKNNDNDGNNEKEVPIVNIHEIFGLFPGETEDEKVDQIQHLSNHFYHQIWHGEETPKNFRDSFVNKFSSSEIQAYRQFNWFSEIFGGPTLVGQAHRDSILKQRTMAKHTSSRMTLEHSMTWLRLMNTSILQLFSDDKDKDHFHDLQNLRTALGRYWLHFYAYFPFTEDERQQFRLYIYSTTCSPPLPSSEAILSS